LFSEKHQYKIDTTDSASNEAVMCAACRANFESDDEQALVASILLHPSDGLRAFVKETVKHKGITMHHSQYTPHHLCF
jgi:hypothetical protein